jgi:hypothetical protein
MIKLYPELNRKLLEISEGDEEFKSELTKAIHNGLNELKSIYSKGYQEKDSLIIQQIRHKVKPTLAMFEFEDLIVEIQKGKEILETQGFSENFSIHVSALDRLIDAAIYNVDLLLK